ncbi:hypothetical protein M408DRAFT_51123, partial [Serendipita vermifera MAFF 305830]
SRELITFIPIIAATGKLVSGVVVFPGKLLRESWYATLNKHPMLTACSATCSSRGFMMDLLGLEFIKLFHKQTIEFANEGPRLLHVDCHSSHINLPLIEF